MVELHPIGKFEGFFASGHTDAGLGPATVRIKVAPVAGAGMAVDVHLSQVVVVEEAHGLDFGDGCVATAGIGDGADVDGNDVLRRVVHLDVEAALVYIPAGIPFHRRNA